MSNDEYKYDLIPIWLMNYYNSLPNREKKNLKKKLKKRLDELGLSY